MEYVKQTWIDGTSSANAERLNYIENGIYNNSLDKTYSTDEINTGKVWIDGKPIYRKVYTTTIPSSESVTSISLSTIGIFNYDYIYFANGSRKMLNNNNIYASLNGLSQTIYIDKTNNVIRIPAENASMDYIFVFEYTKTTD